MKLYIPVPYKISPSYPSLIRVEAYTENYRLNFMDRFNPDKCFHRFEHAPTIEVLVIGGMRDYFLIYSYPPAGFMVASPADIPNLELWRGWILHWLWNEKEYRLDTSTQEHGEAAFKARKTELGY